MVLTKFFGGVFMNHKKVLLASLLAASGFVAQSAYAVSNWVGTANYAAAPTAAGTEGQTGNFDTFDLAPGVVLLQQNGGPTAYNGYFQSYVTSHLLNNIGATAPGLDLGNNTGDYEVTATASFTETFDPLTSSFNLTGGTLDLWFDTTPDKSFVTDSGFTGDANILHGTIIAGSGGLFNLGSYSAGFTDLTVRVDSYNHNVFSPNTIVTGSSIFTLRVNNPADASFLSGIGSVMNHIYDPTNGDVKLAADGYLTLAVPEAKTYAMMLAGLGLVGFMARRKIGMAA
jgi:hypothetical protein